MKKGIIVSVLVLFIVYTIVALFVEIPKTFNNIFYGIVTALAIYVGVFYTNIGQGIKEKLQENNKNFGEKKANNMK